MPTGERETRVLTRGPVELRADEGQSPRLSGYASLFDDPFDVGGSWGWREIVAPGAFTRALRENQDVRLLVNHEGLPLARTASGTLTLSEDARGLAIAADLEPSDPDVQALLPKVTRGDLNQMSIAFVVQKESWAYGRGSAPDVRTIQDVDLWDVSVVTYPANANTSASLRAAGIEGIDLPAALRICARAERGAEIEADDRVLLRRVADLLARYSAEPAAAARSIDVLRRQLDLAAIG